MRRSPKSGPAGAVQESKSGNVTSIQFLRFVAATLVVFVHSTEAISQRIPGSISGAFLQNAFLGASGVHIFFVISGFIMVYTSFYRSSDGPFSTLDFLWRRIVRIFPIYWVYCVLYIYFYHYSLDAPFLSIGNIIGALLLLPGYSYEIIGPGWTLAYEVYFYLCFSIAMVLGLKRGLCALTVFFLISILLRFFIDTSPQAIFVFTNSLLIEFLLGAWIGYATVLKTRVGDRLAKMMIAAALAGFLGGIIFGFHRLPTVLTWGVPSALLVAGLVFWERNGHVPTIIRKFSFLGDSSYSLYLLHVLLIDAVILLAIYFDSSLTIYARQIGSYGMIVVCCVITVYCIAVASISYKLVELRLTSRLRDLFRRKKIGAPASQ
jgi:exopolysaccharide production protein ExoZ